MKRLLIFFLLALFAFGARLNAQEKGEPPPEYNPDTTFIFDSPRPLITPKLNRNALPNALGIDLIFSNSGFGVGSFYQRSFSTDFYGFVSLYISGYRNTDEFDTYNPLTGRYEVNNKINRIFIFPLMFGVQKNFFQDEIANSFRPYLNAGFGPLFILATPYEKEFFNSFGYADLYTRAGGFIGLGANFGSSPTSLMGANIRYYYAPFGGNGLESIKGAPIENFGGVFLSLTLGTRY